MSGSISDIIDSSEGLEILLSGVSAVPRYEFLRKCISNGRDLSKLYVKSSVTDKYLVSIPELYIAGASLSKLMELTKQNRHELAHDILQFVNNASGAGVTQPFGTTNVLEVDNADDAAVESAKLGLTISQVRAAVDADVVANGADSTDATKKAAITLAAATLANSNITTANVDIAIANVADNNVAAIKIGLANKAAVTTAIGTLTDAAEKRAAVTLAAATVAKETITDGNVGTALSTNQTWRTDTTGQWYLSDSKVVSGGFKVPADSHVFSIDNGLHVTTLTYLKLRTLTYLDSIPLSAEDLFHLSCLRLKMYSGSALGSATRPKLNSFNELSQLNNGVGGAAAATKTTIINYQMDVLQSMNAYAPANTYTVPMLNSLDIQRQHVTLLWTSITNNNLLVKADETTPDPVNIDGLVSSKYNLIKKTYFTEEKLSVDNATDLGLAFNLLKDAGYPISEIIASKAITKKTSVNVAIAPLTQAASSFITAASAGIVVVDFPTTQTKRVNVDTLNPQNRLQKPATTGNNDFTNSLVYDAGAVFVGSEDKDSITGDNVMYCTFTADEVKRWRETSTDSNVLSNYGLDFTNTKLSFKSDTILTYIFGLIDGGKVNGASTLIKRLHNEDTGHTDSIALAAAPAGSYALTAINDFLAINKLTDGIQMSYNSDLTVGALGWVFKGTGSLTLTDKQVRTLKYSAILHLLVGFTIGTTELTFRDLVYNFSDFKDTVLGDVKLTTFIPQVFQKSTYLSKTNSGLKISEQIEKFNISVTDAFVKMGVTTSLDTKTNKLIVATIIKHDSTDINYHFGECLKYFSKDKLVATFDTLSLMTGAYLYARGNTYLKADNSNVTVLDFCKNSANPPVVALSAYKIATNALKWSELLKVDTVDNMKNYYTNFYVVGLSAIGMTGIAAQAYVAATALDEEKLPSVGMPPAQFKYSAIRLQYPETPIGKIYEIIGSDITILLACNFPTDALQSVADLSSVSVALSALSSNIDMNIDINTIKSQLVDLNFNLKEYADNKQMFSLGYMLTLTHGANVYDSTGAQQPGKTVRVFEEVYDRLALCKLYYPLPVKHSQDVLDLMSNLASSSNDYDVLRKVSQLNTAVAAEIAAAAVVDAAAAAAVAAGTF